MAMFEITMHYTNSDGTPGVLQCTRSGKLKVQRWCAENRRWLRENRCREVSVSVIPVGSYTHQVRAERAENDGL